MSFDPYEFDRSANAFEQQETLGQYTAKTFLWMVLGLLITFAVAIFCWYTDATLWMLINIPYLNVVLLIATLALSLTMSTRIERMSVTTAALMFCAFSALFGITMSVYLFIYYLDSIIFVFLATAAYFGVLSAFGFLTKRSLAGYGPILASGLVFLIVFYVVSMYIPGLTVFDQIVCMLGIAIFLAYTAYDTQKIKAYYNHYTGYPDMLAKASIFSALQLYLDFINLFVRLLNVLGKKK